MGHFTGPSATPATAFFQTQQLPCTAGRYCDRGVSTPCPGGTYGAEPLLAAPACSGPCAPGYFCPPNSTAATQAPCGGVGVYCPLGSAAPLTAQPGEESVCVDGPLLCTDVTPCRSGQYCLGGLSRPCRAGTFGCATRMGDPDCNGVSGPVCPCVR